MRTIFPTVIHELKVENFKSLKNRLVQFVYEEQKRDPEGVCLSNMGGWQSLPKYNTYDNILSSTIRETIVPYFKNNVINEEHQVRCDGVWININKKGDRNDSHNHPNCHLAGVFWIKCPKEGGILQFQSPHSYISGPEMMVYTSKFREKTNCYPDYWFTPIEGNILIFPAHLNHKVTPHTFDEDRISASFNLSFIL